MKNTYLVNLNGNSVQQSVLIPADAGVKGTPVHLKAVPNVNYQFIRQSDNEGPQNITTKRNGKNLHISFENDAINQPDLIIDDYYVNGDGPLIGQYTSGRILNYVPESSQAADSVGVLVDGAAVGQALGGQELATLWWVAPVPVGGGFPLLAVGLIGLAGLALAGGKGGGSTTAVVVPPDTTPPAVTIADVTPDNTINAAEKAAGVNVTGTNEAGATTTLNGAPVVQDTPTTWHYLLAPAAIAALGAGPVALAVVSTDAAGNTSMVSKPISIDTTPPTVTITAVTPDSTINAAEKAAGVNVTGTNEANATTTLNGVAVIQDSPTTWHSFLDTGAITALGASPAILTAIATDAAGNAASATKVVPIVTTLPTVTIAAVTPDNIINAVEKANGVNVTGTNDAGATTTLNGTAVVQDTPTTWHYALNPTEITALGASPATLTAISTDAAGNSSMANKTVVIDTTIQAPLIADVTPDNTINAAEKAVGVNVTGTNDVGAATTLNGAPVVQDTPTTWHYVLSPAVITPFATSPAVMTVVSTDAAGNSSTVTKPVTLDTTAPDVTIALVTPDNTINMTEKAAGVNVVGTNEAGATTLLNGVPVIQDSTTTWHYFLDTGAITALGASPATLTAVSTDAAGNPGTATKAVMIDITPPPVAISIVTPDNIINTTEKAAGVSVTGTNEAGATTTLNGAAVTQDTPTTWHYALNAAAITALGTSPATLTVISTDVAGNASKATKAITIDTTSPDVTIAPVTPDNIINAAEKAAGVSVTGTNEANATTTLNGVVVIQDTPTTWHSFLDTGAITALGSSPATLTAISTDLAGNPNTIIQTVALITTLPVATIAPVTPDNIINAAEKAAGVNVTGTNDAGSTITLNGVAVVQDTPTTWHYMLNAAAISALGTSPATLAVVSTDAFGNINMVSKIVTIDTTPPSVTIAPVTADNTISTLEKAAGVNVTGTNEAGATTTLNGSAVVQDTPSTWHYTLNTAAITALGANPAPLTAISTDAAGNTSTANKPFAIDTTPPVVTIADVTADNTINIVEKAAGVNVTGTNEVGATTTLNGTAVVQDTTTTWHYTLSTAAITALGASPATLTVVSTDAVGNTSAVSKTVAIDTTPPAVTMADVASDNIINAVEKAAGVTVTGTNEAGATTLLNGAAVLQDSATTWHYALNAAAITALVASPATLTAVSTDAAGNTSMASQTITIDTTPPAVTIAVVTPDNTINAAEKSAGVNVTGTSEAGATTVLNGVAVMQDTSTTWHSFLDTGAITALGASPATLTAVSTDAAGNTGTVNQPVALDITPPPVSIADVTTDNTINAGEKAAGVSVTGTNESGATTTLNGAAVVQDNTTAWHYDLDTAAITALGASPKLTLISTDAAGNAYMITKAVVLDITSPIIQMITTLAGTQAQSTEVGTAYLVKDTLVITDVLSITHAADNLWNQVAVPMANTNTSMSTVGLSSGAYHMYATDAAGNLSLASSLGIVI